MAEIKSEDGGKGMRLRSEVGMQLSVDRPIGNQINDSDSIGGREEGRRDDDAIVR